MLRQTLWVSVMPWYVAVCDFTVKTGAHSAHMLNLFLYICMLLILKIESKLCHIISPK